jgi:4-amino-4-deoxy-L-arabinose transferase-like glycosyltransferase
MNYDHAMRRLQPSARAWLALLVAVTAAKIASTWLVASVVESDLSGGVYAFLARNLLLGHGFVMEPGGPPSLWRGPIYPLLLAGDWSLFGLEHYESVVAGQVVLGIAAAMVIFAIARRLAHPAAAAAAAIATAAYPAASYYTLRYMTESLVTLLLAAFVWTLYAALERDRATLWAAAGGLGGLAALTRPAAILVAPVAAAWLLLLGGRVQLRAATWLVAGSLLVVGPWTIRNARVSGEFIPIATGGGYSFWVGNRLASDGLDDGELDLLGRAEFVSARARIAANPDWLSITPEMDRRFWAAAMEGLADDPMGSIGLAGRRALRLWFSAYTPAMRRWNGALVVMHGSLLLLAAWGAVRLMGHDRTIWPLVLVVLYTWGLHTVVVATARYSVPVVPLLVVLACAGLSDHPLVPARLRGR